MRATREDRILQYLEDIKTWTNVATYNRGRRHALLMLYDLGVKQWLM